MAANVLIFDTETNGQETPELIEAAYLVLNDPQELRVLDMYSQRFRPRQPSTLGALAVHHILDAELIDCEPSSAFTLPAGTAYLIGHNIDYDWQVIGSPAIKCICTLALARALWPQADSHSQSALLYLLLPPVEARLRLQGAHSALVDVENCLILLRAILQRLGGVASWDELWQCSERARVPTRMPFGKHKGELIADVPRDYKAWLMRQPDVDPYLMKALRGEVA